MFVHRLLFSSFVELSLPLSPSAHLPTRLLRMRGDAKSRVLILCCRSRSNLSVASGMSFPSAHKRTDGF